MTEFGGFVVDGEEQRLRALLHRLSRDVRALRYLRVHWAGMGEKDYECYECNEDGYGMQPRWGWGDERRFMLELGRIRGLRELVLDGTFEISWMGYLRKQMGDEKHNILEKNQGETIDVLRPLIVGYVVALTGLGFGSSEMRDCGLSKRYPTQSGPRYQPGKAR
ncbi:predicted protein [Histoplasma capsulatum var. duboisii H88]|uniref:Predicted protein n=1 Tax=Ajellomyces capsulatus (strain H88) TaxID=544711 RepID=F0U7M8_AJEC8|nr:predicted protein [Histoplasma capsulatum var. duboisii H88]